MKVVEIIAPRPSFYNFLPLATLDMDHIDILGMNDTTRTEKGLRRAQHDTTAACRSRKFEQVHFQVNVDALKSLILLSA